MTKRTRERIEAEERAAQAGYLSYPGLRDIGKLNVFAVRDTYLQAAERLIEAGDARNDAIQMEMSQQATVLNDQISALLEANTTMEQAWLSTSDECGRLRERLAEHDVMVARERWRRRHENNHKRGKK